MKVIQEGGGNIRHFVHTDIHGEGAMVEADASFILKQGLFDDTTKLIWEILSVNCKSIKNLIRKA